MKKMKISRIIKSGELNHRWTLYAEKMAEWFVETCFINGDMLHLETQMVKAGTKSLTVYGEATWNNEQD